MEKEERAKRVAEAKYKEYGDSVLARGVEYGYIRGFDSALNMIRDWIDGDSNDYVFYGDISVDDVLEYIKQLKGVGMTDIEERVTERMDWLVNECVPFTLESQYGLIKQVLMDAVTEQKERDIKRACGWLENHGYVGIDGLCTIKLKLDDFRKVMEE